MVKFYHQLQANSDKAQALRQAMLATMKEYPNATNWAAFTLIGEADWYSNRLIVKAIAIVGKQDAYGRPCYWLWRL